SNIPQPKWELEDKVGFGKTGCLLQVGVSAVSRRGRDSGAEKSNPTHHGELTTLRLTHPSPEVYRSVSDG
ncbi:MAG: hypothetical protein ACON32_14995, partial [Pirellulaceae bacterium]